jgi:hypothetical protein
LSHILGRVEKGPEMIEHMGSSNRSKNGVENGEKLAEKNK